MLSRPFNLLAGAPKKDAMKRPTRSLLVLSIALVCMISACSSGGSPNASGSGASGSGATTTTAQPRDARETIAYDPRLSTFATALNESGVLSQLTRGQRVTVFAPDNEAFARVPHASLVALLTQNKKGELAKFMRAHIVRGAIPESALRDGRLKTLDGYTLTIKKSAEGATVTDVRGHTAVVELPAIPAKNAVIYPIKSVLWLNSRG
jgi:uncharacterized surface protein with fasciclin (FAS1) repeats